MTDAAVLDKNRPSWIHGMRMVKFELGKKEPDIRKVECFADDEDAVDDVFVELDLEWKSRQDVEIEIQVLGSDISSLVPNALETQLARLMTMKVGIEDCWLQGRVRIALRPLLWRIPIVGAAQVSFTRMPLFEFKPTVTGGPLGSLLEALLPYVKSWLQETVQEAIFMPYVLPEHYFYPIEPGVPDIKRPVGIMHCRVIEAKKVPKMDMFGSSDTFVEAYVGHGSRKETRIVKGRNPKWDKVFRFPVHVPEFQKVQFVLW